MRELVDFFHAHAVFERVADVPDAIRHRDRELSANFLARWLPRSAPQIFAVAAEAETADFQAAQRLLKRLFERAANRHRLAHALHLRRQAIIGLWEFFEREPRNLGDDIV